MRSAVALRMVDSPEYLLQAGGSGNSWKVRLPSGNGIPGADEYANVGRTAGEAYRTLLAVARALESVPRP